MPSFWASSARRRCSGAISVLPASRARACASANASCVFRVNRFGSTAIANLSLSPVLDAGADRAAYGNELVPVLAMCRLHALLRLLAHRLDARLELGDARVGRCELVLECE